MTRPRALVTLPDVATPSDTGRRLRSWSTIDGLARHYDLDVVIASAAAGDGPHLQNTSSLRRLLIAPVPRPSKARALISSVPTAGPIELFNEDWRKARHDVARWIDGETYDLVWFGAVNHVVGLRGIASARRQVVDYDDLQTAKWMRHLDASPRRVATAPDLLRRRLELPAWRRAERRIARASDAVIVSDVDDVGRCESLGIARPAVVPNSYPDPGFPETALADPPFIVYVGNFEYEPNRLAFAELRDEVLPALRRLHPRITLRLIGKGSSRLAASAQDGAISGLGRVDDVVPHVLGSAATLLPIRTGGGTRIKAMEAFALGIPVVATSFAVTGLNAQRGEHFALADTPTEFASATSRLIEDRALRESMRRSARRLYERRFTSRASADAIADLVAAFDAGRTA